ncbi:hypothetical protein SAMN06264941_1614 [Methanohalophilus portucalensis FDF-1]|nr:hypothetical protein MPF_1254 [Methanohalophilus portucalensis FDF-1]SMH41229.1 hypothetical protein SAMN06264941_1614 [Methanohalophilus portucalensis FDF-1]
MDKSNDSGQMLLLAAFTIGFMIVVSTVMLNNIIYASNMASESNNDISYFEVSNIARMTDEATKAAYYNATKGSSFNHTVFSRYLENYSREVTILYAYSGVSFSFTNSTLYDAYFTKNGLSSGKENWTIIDNVNATDNFTMEVNTSNLGNISEPFEVHALDQSGSSIWFMKIYGDGSNSIEANVSNQTYKINPPLINITGNSTYQFDSSTAGKKYSLKYLNSSNIVGLYSVSGKLSTGESFRCERYKMINATVDIATSKNKINVTFPVTVP